MGLLVALIAALAALADAGPRAPLAAVPEDSAEHAWRQKKVERSRPVDSASWALDGRGEVTFPTSLGRKCVRVNVALDAAKGLPVATARLAIPGEDWRPYNRVSFWLRTDASGFPVLTLMVGIRNAGKEPVAEVHQRESVHNVTIPNGPWTRVDWEIPHIARDRVMSIEFRPWVNKRIAATWDRAAYEIGAIELQRVEPDHYEGWDVAPGWIAFSHTGYATGSRKTAIASGLAADEFQLTGSSGEVVLRKKVTRSRTRLGDFQTFDFSEFDRLGVYRLEAGGVKTEPFHIGPAVWDSTIAKTINFFYGERCGIRISGLHEECHNDWLAVQGDRKIVMNGGWHDAGDLSQGLVNTGEATHAMFSLAAAARESGRNPEWLGLLEEEAKWGLAWIHKVRFPGGFRVGFASMNIWTDGIIGTDDDRTAVALNNPNVNYIAAAAGAAAARYLAKVDPSLARKSLAIAAEDWRHAIAGVETPATLSTPAFAASQVELAAAGVIASLELYKLDPRDEYSRKARELGATILASQQRSYVGTTFPLAGFFYTGPARTDILHQFHRAADHAPATALAMLCDAFPDDSDWMRWYAAAARYGEYQKWSASATAPWGVLPAYVYRDDEWQRIAEGDRYGSSREAYRQQVLGGLPMGGGYYLKAFPVWFTRRGNYGVLLSQAKALAATARLRRDRASADLVQTQLEWVVGRNPFAQSTMFGEGRRFAPQYSVSVGDIVGSLPVGMMTRDNADRPYWPASNTYVFKEVWVHPSARWLATLADTHAPLPPEPFPFAVRQSPAGKGEFEIAVEAPAGHSFTVRTENLNVEPATARSWKARVQSANEPWFAVVVADGKLAHRREISGR